MASTDQGAEEAQRAFAQHQRQAARPSPAERTRTLVAQAKFGTLSTLASKGEEEGHPRGSVVEYAADSSGRPIFSLSSLSSHTADIHRDGRSSFTIMQPGFQDLSQARFTLSGTVQALSGTESASVKDVFRKRHPNSFWIDFGDFTMFRMQPLIARFNFGFASAGTVSAVDYAAAQPDPVTPFSLPIATHMNEDHAAQMLAITRHYVPLDTAISAANLLTLDRLGMEVECASEQGLFTCRVPFVRSAEDRRTVREVIVEMSQAAQEAAAST